MGEGKPHDIPTYKKWLKVQHGIEISHIDSNDYDRVTQKIKTDFSNSNFWKELGKKLETFNQEYQLETYYPLLAESGLPKIEIKPFDSFLLKTFRRNVLENKKWPDQIPGGWILPNNWFSRINDTVRTYFVVKYLDGVANLADKITNLSDKHGLQCPIDFEAREEGYYAVHATPRFSFEIPRGAWDTETVDVSIEIQITTQLQEVIRGLLHKFYEEKRSRTAEPEMKWQWDYMSGAFKSNYLGHVLHYVEGMIMDVREKQKEEKI